MVDIFDPIQDQEAEVVRNLDYNIALCQGEMAAIDAAVGMRSSPGFEAYLRVLENMRAVGLRALIFESDSDRKSVLQGKVQAYDGIIGALAGEEQRRSLLAKKLKALQDVRNSKVLPNGRVVPGGISDVL